MANKQELLDFLDKHVFERILHASSNNHSETDQRKLKEVQDKTVAEKDRFQHYSSAEDIVVNYKRDLHSEAARKVNRELEDLKLPTLASVKEEFLKLAGDKQ